MSYNSKLKACPNKRDHYFAAFQRSEQRKRSGSLIKPNTNTSLVLQLNSQEKDKNVEGKKREMSQHNFMKNLMIKN